jgi:hypothetical protein
MNPTVLIEQIRAGTAPDNIKSFAARGLLPVPADDLIPIQILLVRDKDSNIAAAARSSLQAIPAETWSRLVEAKNPDPAILSFCLQQPNFSPSIKEKIVLNHSIPDSLIAQIAQTHRGAILDLIIHNQVRLLRDPEILKTLERNPLLTIDQRRLIEEFKTEFVFKRQAQAEIIEEIISTSVDDLLAQIPSLDPEAVRIIREVDSKPQERPTEEQVQQQISHLFTQEEMKEIPQDTLTVYQRILQMTQGEKVRVALLGTREERSILIRDSNRQVASMVLRSPKLSDPEMEGIAQMRNLDSELLRQMGQGREFLKRYTVIHSLVKNPKTPSPVALNLLKLLRVMDLRNIARDRNIPEIIRRQAKRAYDLKQDGKQV